MVGPKGGIAPCPPLNTPLIISFENKLQYNAMCNFLKTTAEHKSQQQSKLYNMHMYNMLKCRKDYENINLKLATSEQ